jgi:hypothetical protein
MTVMTMVVMTVPTCLSVCLSVCLSACLSVRCRAWTWTTTSRWTARAAGSDHSPLLAATLCPAAVAVARGNPARHCRCVRRPPPLLLLLVCA